MSQPLQRPDWPRWAQDLAEKYRSRAHSMFVLHGNVRDLVGSELQPLQEFLKKELFSRRDLVLAYDRGGGLSFGTPEMAADFTRALEGYDSFHGTSFAKGLPRNPDGVLNLLDNYLRLRVSSGKRIALILDFAETLAPAGDSSNLSGEDRNTLVILKRWAQNPAFLQADISFCLIAENLVELNPGLVQNPGVASIALPLPNAAERQNVLQLLLPKWPLPEGSDVSPEALAQLTAGLKRTQLKALLSDAFENQRPLTLKALTRRKKELIESESGGLLEFIQTTFDLSMVAGHERAKAKLRETAQALKAGRTEVVPMGFVISGPVGTGKTFLATCFAGEAGVPAVTLKNFRSMWQGVTEGNLERVLALLKAMSPILVMVDEADAQLGDRSSSGDSGVSSRVFAQIAQFMGNTEHRGKVVWFLLTCRPDLLPVDLKRQGRAEEHLALFHPETAEERQAMIQAMAKKIGVVFEGGVLESENLAKAEGLSGADLEAVLVRARMRMFLEGRSSLRASDLQAALEDFIPPSYPTEIELQNLAAVVECTSRNLLPPKFRSLDRGECFRRMEALKQLLEGR